jgi:hypothetical protein
VEREIEALRALVPQGFRGACCAENNARACALCASDWREAREYLHDYDRRSMGRHLNDEGSAS